MSLFGLSTTKIFDKLLEKATSPVLLEPDWETILQLCDVVKSQEVTPKYVVQSIKKKFSFDNSDVVLNALRCLESLMKNCGGSIHKEVAQRDMLESLRELAKNRNEAIREKICEMIQCWSHGLGQQHRIFTDTFNSMKIETFRFPPLKEGEVMFENSDIAPEWRDDKECKECFRCRQVFTTFNRKHHCRACGDIFCDKCSSKQCAIPKFGMDREVRVCDLCYEKLTTPQILTSTSSLVPKPNTSSRPASSTTTKTQTEIDDEESFQLALAISQSEAEEKERQKKILTQKYAMSSFLSAPNDSPAAPTVTTGTNKNFHDGSSDYAELTKYIERGRQEQTNVSNGHTHEPIVSNNETFQNVSQQFVTDQEIDQFSAVVTDHINNFKFRMLSNQQRSRNITTDTAVQSVFVMLQHLHPDLHRFMQLLEEKRAYYENLQDKLNQLKDAREALNALRAEHFEQKQREALERDRQRQIQLAQKLDLMRQKKQEYLEYQRQVHLQRLAQQELEMKARLEQQRQLTFAREQFAQNPAMSMVPFDYSQMPSIDPTNHYSMIPSFAPLPPPQTTSHYGSMMVYPTKTDSNFITYPSSTMPMGTYSVAPTATTTNTGGGGENNYFQSQMPLTMMTNAHTPYVAPVSQPTAVEEKTDTQLIIFD